jgi:hypothetical protein
MGRAIDKRLALDEGVRLAPNDWSSIEVRLLECSESSFRATCDVTLRLHAPVTLEVPGIGPRRAYVAWRRNGEFVAKFEDPIDLDRTKFMSLKQEVVLARLLSERARAHAAGREDEERALRAQIRTGLPVRRAGVQH